jgi:protocatechuate 3,4-dioxygenase beta subunit
MTRRSSLATLGVVAGAAAAGGWRLVANGRAAAAETAGTVSCVLTPELTEGPYFVPNERVRRNITEGRPGAKLRLRLTVLDASTCRPLQGAAVDIWHCDAGGVYSRFGSGAGRNFLRGVQRTDANGVAVFDTIYPGWYQGRAVHIHVMVHVGGEEVHTGQLFFTDALTDRVYRTSPYRRRGEREMRNADDSIYQSGGRRSILTVRRSGSGYLGTLTLGVST